MCALELQRPRAQPARPRVRSALHRRLGRRPRLGVHGHAAHRRRAVAPAAEQAQAAAAVGGGDCASGAVAEGRGGRAGDGPRGPAAVALDVMLRMKHTDL